MKITKTKLKQIIREELEAVINSKRITEVGAREIRGKYSPILAGGTVVDKETGGTVYMFSSDLRSWNWNWNGLNKREAQKILLDMDDDQARKILRKIKEDIAELWAAQGEELEDSGYKPSDAWVRLAAEALGMKDKDGRLPWSGRPDFNPHRQKE